MKWIVSTHHGFDALGAELVSAKFEEKRIFQRIGADSALFIRRTLWLDQLIRQLLFQLINSSSSSSDEESVVWQVDIHQSGIDIRPDIHSIFVNVGSSLDVKRMIDQKLFQFIHQSVEAILQDLLMFLQAVNPQESHPEVDVQVRRLSFHFGQSLHAVTGEQKMTIRIFVNENIQLFVDQLTDLLKTLNPRAFHPNPDVRKLAFTADHDFSLKVRAQCAFHLRFPEFPQFTVDPHGSFELSFLPHRLLEHLFNSAVGEQSHLQIFVGSVLEPNVDTFQFIIPPIVEVHLFQSRQLKLSYQQNLRKLILLITKNSLKKILRK